MADTRCANPEYQLDVDEMMLEYLVWNTVTAQIVEWERETRPGFDDEMQTADSNWSRTDSKGAADTLLSILDSTIHLFKINHPSHPFTANISFYLSLLEFLLFLRTVFKQCGLTSDSQILSDASHAALGDEALRNAARRWRCWSLLEEHEDPDGDIIANVHYRKLLWFFVELQNGLGSVGEENPHHQRNKRIQLIDLLPRFMELSAAIVELSKTGVSDTWLTLASEFMEQAALEVCAFKYGIHDGAAPDDGVKSDNCKDDDGDDEEAWARRRRKVHARVQHVQRKKALNKVEVGERLLECFGWGLPLATKQFEQLLAVIGEGNADRMAVERNVHAMLRSSAHGDADRGDKIPSGTEANAWDGRREIAMRQIMPVLRIPNLNYTEDGKEADHGFGFVDVGRRHARLLQKGLPMEDFEIKLLEFIKGLQAVWVQMNDEPILRQIEQGWLSGLDNAEFRALMDRVGGDERHEEELGRIKLPSVSMTLKS